MRGGPLRTLAIAVLALGLSPAAGMAQESAVKRTPVRKAYVERSGPELSTDSELAAPVPNQPSAVDDAIEEYYREQAEYYRQQRVGESRSSGAACMYGPDGNVIHAPRGKSCGQAPAPTKP